MRVYYLAECGHHRYLGFPCGTCEHNTSLQVIALPTGTTMDRLLREKDRQIDELILELTRLREALERISKLSPYSSDVHYANAIAQCALVNK